MLVIALSSSAQVTGTFTDSRDGKTYKTVKIGTQIWMAENLAFYAGSNCWIYDNNKNNLAIYGYLYDWAATKQICPAGWHLPTDGEWSTLIIYLGDNNVAGGKLKSTSYWTCPTLDSTSNSSGFTALPSGWRDLNGKFNSIGGFGFWWSSTETPVGAWIRGMNCSSSVIVRGVGSKNAGWSVRCLKDN